MKKLILTLTFILITANAQALLLDINWTGNSVVDVNDFPRLGSNELQGVGLGGPVNNSAIAFQAYEFTVKQASYVNYLLISANVDPHGDFWEGSGVTVPNDIDVSFLLFEGTSFSGPGQDEARPDTMTFLTDKYNFRSIDSSTNGVYSDFQIPFKSELNVGTYYWLMADARNEWGDGPAGVTFNYTTDFDGDLALHKIHTPEPSTMLLFGSGLLGAFMRKRKRA